MKLRYLFFFLFILLFLFSSISNISNAQASNVLVVEITGTIDQYSVEIIKESIKQAENKKSEAIILLLDTPGGGLQQTFDIADMINESQIPVVSYVYPSGSAAWSAGTFILLSSHIAAMNDHTIIGSAQPVEITVEGAKPVTEPKTINALVKWIKTRAEMYNRNQSVAARFITENLNLNSTDAKKLGVIEYTSSSIEELIYKINGTQSNTAKGNVTINTLFAKQIKYNPSFGLLFMKFFSNPVLTSLLFMLGIFALIFGISAPGYGAEVFGAIAILLSLIGSGFTIPILSIIFIIVACLLIIIELFVTPGFGVIGFGGIICLIIGTILIVPSYSTTGWVISMDWINDVILTLIVAGVLIASFFVFLLYKILQTRKKKAAIGTFIGETAKTVDRITPEKSGYVRFKGELWTAISDTEIEANKKVIILKKEESTLKIKPKK